MLNLGSFLEGIFIDKNLKRFLVLINISIFLSIFAATAAIISIFIEIEINKKETQMQLYEQELDFWRAQTSRLPLYITNADTVFVTDLNLHFLYSEIFGSQNSSTGSKKRRTSTSFFIKVSI